MSDLTGAEQANVRAALRFLRTRTGRLDVLGKALRCAPQSLRHLLAGRGAISAALTIRTARFVGVGVDVLLAGKFPPPGTCPHCGHREEAGP